MINLALLSEAGKGVKQDFETAFNIFLDLARKGNSQAQRYLADYFRQGILVERDLAEAVKWYRKAAEQGDEEAIYWLKELGIE